MHRITLLLILFLLIPDLYIYFMYIVRKTKNIWLRIAHWIPTLLLIAGYFLLMQGIGEMRWLTMHKPSEDWLSVFPVCHPQDHLYDMLVGGATFSLFAALALFTVYGCRVSIGSSQFL